MVVPTFPSVLRKLKDLADGFKKGRKKKKKKKEEEKKKKKEEKKRKRKRKDNEENVGVGDADAKIEKTIIIRDFIGKCVRISYKERVEREGRIEVSVRSEATTCVFDVRKCKRFEAKNSSSRKLRFTSFSVG